LVFQYYARVDLPDYHQGYSICFMRIFSKAYATLIVLSVILAIPMQVRAATFYPGYIISDEEFTDASSMTIQNIQDFLNRQGGYLASLVVQDFEKNSKPASQAIYEISQMYGISPKVILITLQKEQSLITQSFPSQTALDYAMGYGCPDSGGCSGNAAGFYRQLDFATWQFRKYFTYPTQYTYKAGGSYTFTDLSGTRQTKVTIENQATANLYNYTPHVYNGNYNFFRFLTSWFTKVYPDGSLVRVGNSGGIWLIQNGEKRAFQSRAAFLTRYGDYSKVIHVTADALDVYPRGANISIPNYSLVQTPSGAMYLINGDTKRQIQSMEIFRNLGFNPEEIISVTDEDLTAYQDGVQITNTSAYPGGALAKVKENGGMVWIEQGVWYPILSREILNSRFPNRKATITVTLSELNQYTKGDALKLRDGDLIRVKGSSGVYVISNGQKLPIQSQKIFKKFGYNKKNIIVVSQRIADLHPKGQPLIDISQ
jgi:hypothetical protein